MHSKNLTIDTQINKTPSKKRQMEKRMRKKLENSLPSLDETNQKITSNNALLVLVCIENGDQNLELKPIVDDILKSRALLGVLEIVMGAFGHLSTNVAPPMTAKIILDNLINKTKEVYQEVKSFPFGYDKSLEISVPLHPFNISFRSFS